MDEKFCFIVDWFDPHASFIRKYQLFFFPKDNTVEMYDMKNHRLFLRRCKADGLRMEDLFIGSCVNVLNRQLTFVDYGDASTASKLSNKTERTLGLIKPDAISKMGEILDTIAQNGFLVSRLKMCRLSRDEAFEFYQEHQSKSNFGDLVNLITSGPVIAFELRGENAVDGWRRLVGPTDACAARSSDPRSIRARFGQDSNANAVHGSDSQGAAAREIEYFFPTNKPSRENTAQMANSTCAIIKPHAVINGLAGKIISKIMDRFVITAMQMHHMEQANAEEFYEVYKGVVQEYPDMVKELTSGPCIALEIQPKQPDEDAPRAFRDFTGPADPEIARHLRPSTLRAQFGSNKVKNAVHCTDLPEDGQLEVEYFFKILDQ